MSEAEPQPTALRLEPGGTADLDGVMQVMGASFAPDFGEAWTRSQCAGILPLAGVALTIARDGDGNIQGFTLMRTVADESELLLLAVAPDARRRGIGSILVRHYIDHSQAQGVDRLHLEVRDGNPAVEIYRAFGFSIEGRRPNYYRGRDGSHHDALTMARSIQQG